jgi:hypothetical protein
MAMAEWMLVKVECLPQVVMSRRLGKVVCACGDARLCNAWVSTVLFISWNRLQTGCLEALLLVIPAACD